MGLITFFLADYILIGRVYLMLILVGIAVSEL